MPGNYYKHKLNTIILWYNYNNKYQINEGREKMKQKIRTSVLVLSDIVLLNLSFIFSLLIRFDSLPEEYINLYLKHIIVYLLIKLVVFKFFELYSSLWRYASIGELVKLAMAVVTSNALVISYLVKERLF